MSKSRKKYKKEKTKRRTSSSEKIIHYKYKIGKVIKDRYKITKWLGDGTFGRVLEVKDLKYNEYYAMKVIRSVKRYIESAEIEANILFKL